MARRARPDTGIDPLSVQENVEKIKNSRNFSVSNDQLCYCLHVQMFVPVITLFSRNITVDAEMS